MPEWSSQACGRLKTPFNLVFSTPEPVPLDGSTTRCSVGVVGEAACWCGTVAEEALFQQHDGLDMADLCIALETFVTGMENVCDLVPESGFNCGDMGHYASECTKPKKKPRKGKGGEPVSPLCELELRHALCLLPA